MNVFASTLAAKTGVLVNIRVGVAWCSTFDRPRLKRLHGIGPYRPLRYAYRAPSLFLQGMLRAGADVEFVEFDDELTPDDLTGAAQAIDVLYVATHGMAPPQGYTVAMHAADWRLAPPFGVGGPTVAIFDTCHLVDRTDPTWPRHWQAGLGPALRLVLGFSTFATVGARHSERGAAFARELTTMPLTAAWFTAVGNTSYTDTDVPVAIAFGDDHADALDVLANARADALPPPLTVHAPSVVVWP